jgi:hypothetical protein
MNNNPQYFKNRLEQNRSKHSTNQIVNQFNYSHKSNAPFLDATSLDKPALPNKYQKVNGKKLLNGTAAIGNAAAAPELGQSSL